MSASSSSSPMASSSPPLLSSLSSSEGGGPSLQEKPNCQVGGVEFTFVDDYSPEEQLRLSIETLISRINYLASSGEGAQAEVQRLELELESKQQELNQIEKAKDKGKEEKRLCYSAPAENPPTWKNTLSSNVYNFFKAGVSFAAQSVKKWWQYYMSIGGIVDYIKDSRHTLQLDIFNKTFNPEIGVERGGGPRAAYRNSYTRVRKWLCNYWEGCDTDVMKEQFKELCSKCFQWGTANNMTDYYRRYLEFVLRNSENQEAYNLFQSKDAQIGEKLTAILDLGKQIVQLSRKVDQDLKSYSKVCEGFDPMGFSGNVPNAVGVETLKNDQGESFTIRRSRMPVPVCGIPGENVRDLIWRIKESGFQLDPLFMGLLNGIPEGEHLLICSHLDFDRTNPPEIKEWTYQEALGKFLLEGDPKAGGELPLKYLESLWGLTLAKVCQSQEFKDKVTFMAMPLDGELFKRLVLSEEPMNAYAFREELVAGMLKPPFIFPSIWGEEEELKAKLQFMVDFVNLKFFHECKDKEWTKEQRKSFYLALRQEMIKQASFDTKATYCMQGCVDAMDRTGTELAAALAVILFSQGLQNDLNSQSQLLGLAMGVSLANGKRLPLRKGRMELLEDFCKHLENVDQERLKMTSFGLGPKNLEDLKKNFVTPWKISEGRMSDGYDPHALTAGPACAKKVKEGENIMEKYISYTQFEIDNPWSLPTAIPIDEPEVTEEVLKSICDEVAKRYNHPEAKMFVYYNGDEELGRKEGDQIFVDLMICHSGTHGKAQIKKGVQDMKELSYIAAPYSIKVTVDKTHEKPTYSWTVSPMDPS